MKPGTAPADSEPDERAFGGALAAADRTRTPADNAGRPVRLAVVVTHPIQHFCPQYASWAANVPIELCVFFGSSAGLEAYEDKEFGRTVKWEGLRLDTFPHVFLGDGSARPVSDALDAPDLDAQLDRFNPDAVFVYGYSQRLQRRARAWALRNGRKVLYYADSELRHTRPRLRSAVKQLILPRYFRSVDAFATVGDANEAYYQAYRVPADRFVRLAFPIDIASYETARGASSELRTHIRERHEIKPGDFVVSMVGKFLPYKRQADLIRMLDHLAEEPRHVVVLLIGTGPDEAVLRSLAASRTGHRVVFTDFVAPADLPGYYAASDVYVHSSQQDAHSIAVTEAVYMGCPVIISDRCGSYGPMDDVQVGRNGTVYPCGDVRSLASSVDLLRHNEALRCEMAAASREHGTLMQRRAHGEGLQSLLRVAGLHAS